MSSPVQHLVPRRMAALKLTIILGFFEMHLDMPLYDVLSWHMAKPPFVRQLFISNADEADWMRKPIGKSGSDWISTVLTFRSGSVSRRTSSNMLPLLFRLLEALSVHVIHSDFSRLDAFGRHVSCLRHSLMRTRTNCTRIPSV